jgi:hypothetical protein
MLKLITKNQMLLEFKLEETQNITTSSTTTTTTTTITTTSTTTTTTTTSPQVGPLCTYAVFANNSFTVASHSIIDANTQVNGELDVIRSGNTFLGNTNVVGRVIDSGGNTFQNLVQNVAPVPYPAFELNCLLESSTIFINGNVDISSQAAAAIYQGQTVFVKGNVYITGSNISITGGGIIATGTINVSGGNFTYTSTGCLALYSYSGDINIVNGPYNIKGLIFAASPVSNITLSGSQGGSVCGALFSGRDIYFTGDTATHIITNTGGCSPCIPCTNNPCLIT